MVTAYLKNLRRMFLSNILRLTAISLIVAIGISVATGICAVPLQIHDALKSPAAASLSGQQIFIINELADKIALIANVLPPFFIFVSVLTALTTVSRLVDEERPVFACYKTLGYSDSSIIIRYLVFAFACAAIGCLLGIIGGNFLLRPLIYNVVKIKFNLPAVKGIYFGQGLIWSAAMSTAIVLTALTVSALRCREKPSQLLRPRSPKAGKKIFLEYAPFIWKRLKFKFKSSIRNIFRYKGKLIMTVISVAGSTAMLFVGLGLISSVNSAQNQSLAAVEGFSGAMNAIAVIITLCGAGLAVLVLFNLTNINIEERRREIATLKVLGYKPMEVAGYIYRELLILSIMGILIGLPSGYFLEGFLFEYLDFGSPDIIGWEVWIGVVSLAAVSVVLADFLLYKKICNIQMITSLKVIE